MLSKLQKLQKTRQSDNKGFTIIEVMIVLAIAGLILLIVFLAVPALQRNARNTQRKNDAANLSGVTSTFISNNNGTLPVAIGNGTANSVDVCAVAGTTSGALGAACGAGNSESSKVGFFTQANVWINSAATAAAPITPTVVAQGSETVAKVSTQTILVVLNESCGPAGTGIFTARSVALFYVTESATGNGSLQCTS